MKKIIKLNETDLMHLLKKIIAEQVVNDEWKTCIRNTLSRIKGFTENKRFENNAAIGFITQEQGIVWMFYNDGSFRETQAGSFGASYARKNGKYTCQKNGLIIKDSNNSTWSSTTNKWATSSGDSGQGQLNADDIKKFQIFLDTYYDGWLNGGKIGNNPKQGYGTFGPKTKQMYAIKSIKSQFEKQKNNIKIT